VVFLYRGPVKDVGIAGDLLGIRREDPMIRVPGTDLFYYEARVEPGSRVSYHFLLDFGKPVPDPRNPRRVPAAGPDEQASSLAMPGWVSRSSAEQQGSSQLGWSSSQHPPVQVQKRHCVYPLLHRER
jgi:hypothetical protein